jgi:hypothetical protein
MTNFDALCEFILFRVCLVRGFWSGGEVRDVIPEADEGEEWSPVHEA